MPECVAPNPLSYPGLFGGRGHGALQDGLMHVMRAPLQAQTLPVLACRRKHPTPSPLPTRVGCLAIHRPRQGHVPAAGRYPPCHEGSHLSEMRPQGSYQCVRHHGDAITPALSLANPQFFPVEIEILHPNLAALAQTQAGAIQQRRHQQRDAIHLLQHTPHRISGQDVRQTMRNFGRQKTTDYAKWLLQYVPIQELQRGSRYRFLPGRISSTHSLPSSPPRGGACPSRPAYFRVENRNGAYIGHHDTRLLTRNATAITPSTIANVPLILPVKYNATITSASTVRMARSSVPMFFCTNPPVMVTATVRRTSRARLRTPISGPSNFRSPVRSAIGRSLTFQPMPLTARILVVAATARELAPPEGWRTLQCGVGPVEAAIATSSAIAHERPSAILHVGIAGARRRAHLAPAALVVGSEARYVDLGVPADWAPNTIPASVLLLAGIRRLFPSMPTMPIGTTASVGGTIDAAARSFMDPCEVEAMEGFGVLRAAQQAGVPAIEVRAISNEIEEQDRARWYFDAAFKAITDATPALVAAVRDALRQPIANH